MIYFWSMDQSRKQTSRMMNANNNLVCQVFRSLEDVCSTDIARNPFIPFGGRSIVKCDESKFNHKAKVSSILRSHLQYRFFFKQSKLQEALFSLNFEERQGEKERPHVGDTAPSRPREAFSAIAHYVSRTTVLEEESLIIVTTNTENKASLQKISDGVQHNRVY